MKLERIKQEALKSKEIELLYEYVDMVNDYNDKEDDVEEVYEVILAEAMERVAEYLSRGQFFNPDDSKQRLYLRAIYENAISKYSDEEYLSAKELFLLLSQIVDVSAYKEAFVIHAKAADANIPVYDLLEVYADKRMFHEKDIFVLKFKKDLYNKID